MKFNANASDHVRYDKDKEPYSFLKTIDGKRSIPYAAQCSTFRLLAFLDNPLDVLLNALLNTLLDTLLNGFLDTLLDTLLETILEGLLNNLLDFC